MELIHPIANLARVLLLRKAPLAVLSAGLFCFCLTASTQISLVHVTPCGPAAFPGTACTIPATGTGNLIVVAWQGGGNTSTTLSVADNAGNTYAEASRSVDVAGGLGYIWYAKNSVAGATSVTITPSPSVPNSSGALIYEFSGVNASAPLDQSTALNTQAASATPSGAAVTTTSAVEVVVSLAEVANNVAGIMAGNAFTNDSTLIGNGWAHLITSSAGTYNAQWNQSPAGTYASSTASFRAASGGALNSCDLNQDGVVNPTDVNLAVNMDLGLTPCTANIAGPGVCNVVVVQRVINASLPNGICVLGNPHTVSLTWVASTSPNIAGYNIYRSTTPNGTPNKLSLSPIGALNYTDNTVQSGTTYYYTATAVDTSANESVPSSPPVQAVVPYP